MFCQLHVISVQHITPRTGMNDHGVCSSSLSRNSLPSRGRSSLWQIVGPERLILLLVWHLSGHSSKWLKRGKLSCARCILDPLSTKLLTGNDTIDSEIPWNWWTTSSGSNRSKLLSDICVLFQTMHPTRNFIPPFPLRCSPHWKLVFVVENPRLSAIFGILRIRHS